MASFRRWIQRLWQTMQPGPRARKGAAWGAATAAAVAAGFCGIWLEPGLGKPWDVPAGIFAALLLSALTGLGLILALKLLNLLPRFLGWAGFAAIGAAVLAGLAFGLPPELGSLIGVAIALAAGALGGSVAVLLGKEPLHRAKGTTLAVVALAVLAAAVWGIVWIAGRGSREHLVRVKAAPPIPVAPIQAADPSQPGPYHVLQLTYGSGTDRRRPEFGKNATLKTKTVDATPFVTGNEGWRVAVRKWFWGFGFKAFPLNGRVWYPDGRGPFPLVLIVHGNHDMSDFSDPGYAYLGELLASRGFITVSVDENFFNGFWSGGVKKENDGRGWLLLKHLEVWRGWSRTPGNPFAGKVDLEHIALVGHSRGGEAVAIAALFNQLPRYPDDADVPLGFRFKIRSIVAIAPIDGQYKPAGQPTPVSGVSYLVLQGGHDGDVSIFAGDRQYRRVTFDPGTYGFKAELYSYRSNHGQFNTVWGDADAGWPSSFLLNRKALLDPEAQRRLAKVAISAFLEATLHEQRSYIPLFRDLRAAQSWFPQDLYITRFQDSTFQTLADYEEDVDVTTASLPGATFEGRRLALWKEEDLPFRKGDGTKENQVALLGWRRETGEPPAYILHLPSEVQVTAGKQLALCLADADQEPPDAKEKQGKELSDAEKKAKEKRRDERKKREKKEGKEPLDLTVELVAADGVTARLPLSHFRALPVPLKSRFTKLSDESDLYGKAWEPVLQTFELPFAAFVTAQPGFAPETLREIRLVFDRSPEGVVIVDDVGIAEP
jgi:dienelactone hydrolase